MKKILSTTVVLVLILCIFPLSIPQTNAQPSEWIQLTTNPHGDVDAAYSPNGEKIAFQRARTSPPWYRDIWIMNADGSNQTLLIEDNNGGGVAWPHWSPDGTKIVFAEYYNDYRTDIVVFDLNTGSRTAVVENWKPNHTPKWSPDGSKILFNHEDEHIPGGLWNLYTINLTDGQIEKITHLSTYHQAYPGWSPDGSKIVVMRAPAHDQPHDIFLMDADGSNESKVVDYGRQPMFFPDGNRILFWRDCNLFSVNTDGTNVVQLTDCPSDWWLESGTVSPDGSEIAFSARRPSERWNLDVYKITVVLCEPLTTGLYTDRNPAALRDNTGKIWVFFESNRPGGNPWAMWYKTSSDNGNTWSLPHLLITSMYSNAPFSESGIDIIQDTGHTMWLVFSTSKTPGGGDNEVWFMTSDDGGNIWSNPQTPYEGANPGFSAPTIIEAFDRIWIFFMSFDGLKYVSSDDGGSTWSSPASLSADKDSLHPHSIRDVDGNIWLFFERQLGYGTGMELTRNITCMKSTDGVTWSPQRNIEEMGPGPEWYPWAVQDYLGKIIVFFDAYRDYATRYDRNIHYVESNDDGVTWSDPEAFTLNPKTDWDATAVMTYEGLLVFWVSDRSGNWDIWYRLWPRAPPAEDTEAYVEYVNETIQDLPDEIFNETAEDVPDVMNDFSDLFNDTLENINQEDYEGAIEKLNSIKEGIYEDIMESDERQQLIDLIDNLIAYLETLI